MLDLSSYVSVDASIDNQCASFSDNHSIVIFGWRISHQRLDASRKHLAFRTPLGGIKIWPEIPPWSFLYFLTIFLNLINYFSLSDLNRLIPIMGRAHAETPCNF